VHVCFFKKKSTEDLYFCMTLLEKFVTNLIKRMAIDDFHPHLHSGSGKGLWNAYAQSIIISYDGNNCNKKEKAK